MSRTKIYQNAGEALSFLAVIEADGQHLGADNASVLVDSSDRRLNTPFTAAVLGKTVFNFTDNSFGVITAYTKATITATLQGGTGNDWDTNDVYVIGDPSLAVSEISKMRVIAEEEVTVVTPGTPVNPSSNVAAKAIRVVNNNDPNIVVAGGSLVDAVSAPIKGVQLFEADSRILIVKQNANEIYIDADVANTAVWVEILGY
jgi:hypothetical protein